MDNPASIMWGVLFGSVGMGYLMYGRRERRGIALLSGVVLCVFPYFISSVVLMFAVAFVVMALPYFLRF